MSTARVAGALAVVTAAAGSLRAQCPDGTPPPCRATPVRVVTAAPAQNSVAVLYFDNLSRDTADAYLVDGLTEETILRLGEIRRLTVKSRGAVERFRGRSGEDPAALGRALGVAHLVTGSVRRSPTRLRVTVALVRAGSGVQLWGEAFDRSDADLLAIEEDIARAVATAVAGQLAPEEHATLASRPTRNSAAYDLFLRGKHSLRQRTPESARRGIGEFESAVRLDPTFSRALAGIGYAYALFLDWGWGFPGLPQDSVLARGFDAANRALALDSTTADAWMARGYLLSFRNPATYEGVRTAFDRAIALDPRNAEAHHQYGWLLAHLGDRAAALAAWRRALALEPERAITLFTWALDLLVAGRYGEALALYDSALAVDRTAEYVHGWRGWARLKLGDLAGARSDAEQATRVGPTANDFSAQATLAALEAHQGDTAAARSRMERLGRGLVPNASVSFIWAAAGLLAVGDSTQAVDWLQRVQPHGLLLGWYLRSRMFDPLRSNPRFQRLVEETRPPGAPR